MKRFSLFLTEAGTSQASMQAAKLNLKSDGHGSWFDSRGNFVATTEKGKLVFLKGRKKKGEEEGPGRAKGKAEEPKAQEGPVKQMATRRADDDLAGAPL